MKSDPLSQSNGLRRLHRTARRVADASFGSDSLYQQRGYVTTADAADPVDFLVVPPGQPDSPAEVFHRLRWGGQVAILTDDRHHLRHLAQSYQARSGFMLEQGPRAVPTGPLQRLMRFGRPQWYSLLARRTALLPPGQVTDRFTFHVELARSPTGDGYAVVKKVPSYGSVMVRLKERFPTVAATDLATRARKLVDKIFPVFLTREAAFLRMLQKSLPTHLRNRVPNLLGAERGKDGLTRKIAMSWLRLGAEPIDQLDFALQLAEFVMVLHDQARIVHLDLRMDNIVITDRGVGLVDFGSAVGLDEDLSESPLLSTLFTEMMSTSHIQRLLGRMKDSGRVTSEVLVKGHQKVDKAADLFYLAMQMANPHTSPDLVPLIRYDKSSSVARRVHRLTQTILCPQDPVHPRYRTAADVLNGLRELQQTLRIDPQPLATDPSASVPRPAFG